MSPAFAPPYFDDSRWPLLLLRLPGILSEQGHEECLTLFSNYLQRGEKFVLIVDLSRIGLVPLNQRWRQLEWFDEHEQSLRELVLGGAIITTSPVVRLSISALLFFKPFPIPHRIFSNRDAAETWVAERLEEAGYTQARGRR